MLPSPYLPYTLGQVAMARRQSIRGMRRTSLSVGLGGLAEAARGLLRHPSNRARNETRVVRGTMCGLGCPQVMAAYTGVL